MMIYPWYGNEVRAIDLTRSFANFCARSKPLAPPELFMRKHHYRYTRQDEPGIHPSHHYISKNKMRAIKCTLIVDKYVAFTFFFSRAERVALVMPSHTHILRWGGSGIVVCCREPWVSAERW